MTASVLKLDPSSHDVFCPNKYCSFEPLMCLELVRYSLNVMWLLLGGGRGGGGEREKEEEKGCCTKLLCVTPACILGKQRTCYFLSSGFAIECETCERFPLLLACGFLSFSFFFLQLRCLKCVFQIENVCYSNCIKLSNAV